MNRSGIGAELYVKVCVPLLRLSYVKPSLVVDLQSYSQDGSQRRKENDVLVLDTRAGAGKQCAGGGHTCWWWTHVLVVDTRAGAGHTSSVVKGRSTLVLALNSP